MPEVHHPITKREYDLLRPLLAEMDARIQAAQREAQAAEIPVRVAFASICAARELPTAAVFKGIDVKDGVFVLTVQMPDEPATPPKAPGRPARPRAK